jgi:glycosyltransferase involved in cell wall biosynthesis
MKRLLFIGHDASRSGAPFVLLFLLQWIRSNHPECEVDLLLLQGGELVPEYRKTADVFVLSDLEKEGSVRRLFRRIGNRLSVSKRLKVPSLPHFERDYDTVVGNTVVTLRCVEMFKKRGFRTVSWIHELDGAVETLGLTSKLAGLARCADRFIVGSQAVAAMLGRFDIERPVDVIYEFSPRGTTGTTDTAMVRRELGLPDDAFVIGACGTIEHRKGADLFVRLAEELSQGESGYRFIWIARNDAESDPMYGEMTDAIATSGTADRVTIVRADESPERFLSAIDVFTLTSREDPFPLVCLEAANLGKPIVCFEGAGGMPEFVGNDAGAVVPFGDVEAMAASLRDLCRHSEKRLAAGRTARSKCAGEFSPDMSCRKIYSVLIPASPTKTNE